MILKKLKQQLTTPEKFFDTFLASPEGQASFDAGLKKFPNSKKNGLDNELFIDFIIEHIVDWLVEHLSDDEMNEAYDWIDSLEFELREMIISKLT